MLSLVVFTDIDDTLIQTMTKCPSTDGLKALGFDSQGNALSYATQQQQSLIRLFKEKARVIPVTGRNLKALKQTDIGFHDAPYLVTSHGAMVYENGLQPAAGWKHPLDYADQQQHLADVEKQVEQWMRVNKVEGRCRIIIDHDAPVYVSVKAGRSSRCDWLHEMKQEFIRDWSQHAGDIHLNGNNLAFLPVFADKAAAVSFLKGILGDCLYIGVGDSYSDQGFLNLCDFQMIPSNSQIVNGDKT